MYLAVSDTGGYRVLGVYRVFTLWLGQEQCRAVWWAANSRKYSRALRG